MRLPLVGSEGVAIGADTAELERFADLAEHWWDEAGRWRRCTSSTWSGSAISATTSAHLGRDPLREHPLGGLAVLDVGCGGGSVRAACPPRRYGHRHRSHTGQHRGGRLAARPGSRSTTGWRPLRSWLPRRGGSTWCAPWKWSSTSPTRRVFSRPAPPWSAGRRPGPGDPEPYLSRLRARHRRRRVCARLAAARHAQLVALRAALRSRPPAPPRRLRIEDLSGVVYDPLRDRFRLSRDAAVNYMLFATRG